jgi:stage II sporulation protein D
MIACGGAPPGARPLAGRGAEPDIRVALATGASYVEIAGQGRVGGVSDGRTVFTLGAGEAVRVDVAGGGVRVSGTRAAGRYERLTFVSLEPSRHVIASGKPYRGVIEVFRGGGGLTVVNELPMEAYLASVVTTEMGRRPRAERAALEAQAVVSRTYAITSLGKYASDGYDLSATVSDQAYGGVVEETEIGREAVRATAGRIVTYGGEPITTFFSSTCGFSTASPQEVFRFGTELPYLAPVSDRRPGGGHYCDQSPRFRWTVEWDGATLSRILRETVPAVLGVEGAMVDELRGVRVHHTGPSGRVVEARVAVSRGEIPVFGPDLRRVFRTPEGRSLGSTAFEVAVDKRAGRVERVTFAGAGWGHGVGMCQWGAVGRARAGQSGEEIVTTYFAGTRIERYY